MNSDYEQNQQGLLFFMIYGPNMSSNIIKLYMMDSRLKRISIKSKNIRNGVRTKKLGLRQKHGFWINFDSISPKTQYFLSINIPQLRITINQPKSKTQPNNSQNIYRGRLMVC